MARISISLPEELMARLEPVKDRLNVSQICREALEGRIGMIEHTKDSYGDSLDLPSLVARLKEERCLAEGRWVELGQRNASEWLRIASYVELKEISENINGEAISKYRLPHSAFKTMKKDMVGVEHGLEGPAAAGYKTAWLDRVKDIWTQVKDQVEEPKVAVSLDPSD